MKKSSCIIVGAILILLAAFFGRECFLSLELHWNLFRQWRENDFAGYYPWYLWLGIGCLIFPVKNKFRKNESEFYRTLTHELSHLFVGIITFRKIHSFNAESRGSGSIVSSGNESFHFLTSLAPYCFLFYTVILLLFRIMVKDSMLPVIDVLVGFTVGFHIVCFREQTRNNQTDISRFPLWFSYIYIVEVWIFDLAMLLSCYEPENNIFLIFKDFAIDLFDLITKWIF